VSLSSERILTTHAGSLPRPGALLELLRMRERGEPIDEQRFAEHVRGAVIEVVRLQADAGVDIVGDGEAGRFDFASYAKYHVEGYGGMTTKFPGSILADLEDYPEVAETSDKGELDKMVMPLCDRPIAHRAEPIAGDVANLTDAVAKVDVVASFMTSVSPGEMSLYLPNAFYATQDEYLAALVGAMREEYETIHRAGHIVQVDAPDLALGFHVYYRGSTIEEFRRHVAAHVEAINAATERIPAEAMRMHVCYGPMASPHHRDIDLRHVLDLILRAKPAGLNFEGANGRHGHEWRLFEEFELPEGKYLIPGVIDVTTNRIEHPGLVAERITRLARLVGRENVVAGTDCGFATLSVGKNVLPRLVWAKLQSLAEGAQIATEQLW
jgi:5-methyltetrahydropteroyltriglutamate--homocysteine methyltransferase